MGKNVFADGMEIADKASSGKSIAAFPDPCFTPPQTPATPPGVPIPYPNTSMASDTAKGSKNVKIGGKEIMLKDKSNFKKSVGNEAGSAPKKGLISSTNKGKSYFAAFSMSVKIEGENAVRHLDITTHNHSSPPTNTPPWPFLSKMALENGDNPCEGEKEECRLTPYKKKCPGGKTPHHVVPVHCFMAPGARSMKKADRIANTYEGCKKYNPSEAPCICVEGASKTGVHGDIHKKFDKIEDTKMVDGKAGSWSVGEAEKAGAESVKDTCGSDCIEAQLKNYHEEQCGMKSNTPIRADSTGRRTPKGFTPSIQKRKRKRL